jgi:hypothetical protein
LQEKVYVGLCDDRYHFVIKVSMVLVFDKKVGEHIKAQHVKYHDSCFNDGVGLHVKT